MDSFCLHSIYGLHYSSKSSLLVLDLLLLFFKATFPLTQMSDYLLRAHTKLKQQTEKASALFLISHSA